MNEKEAPKSPQQDYYSELIRSLDFYYSRGWRCIPVKAGDKTPLISNWSQKFLTQEEMLNWIRKNERMDKYRRYPRRSIRLARRCRPRSSSRNKSSTLDSPPYRNDVWSRK